MISLPPGCSVSYNITIDIDKLTDDIVEWYRLIDGIVTEEETYDWRGRAVKVTFVKYGKSKKCYHLAGGGGTRLHFDGADASTASMFLLKFDQHVVNHNLKEHQELQFG